MGDKKMTRREERRGKRLSSLLPHRPSAVWRLLDANANRAREGLRILEDTARFVWDDASGARALRKLRHSLDSLVRAHYKKLLAARSTETDTGRHNAAKSYKGGVSALVAANFKRVEEALRVLEEYGRVLSPKAVVGFQALRFEVYRLEKRKGSRNKE